MSFDVLLASLRGMCQGVSRAILTVEKALEKYGDDKVWVLHEVVHNTHVVNDLKSRGAHFVETLEEVPDGAVLIFSAHGVGLDTFEKAKSRGFTIIDATCPVVTHIHRKMNMAGDAGQDAIVIGHKGHQEVIGTIGQYRGDKSHVHVILTPDDVENLTIEGNNSIFVTQTTLSVDETAKTVKSLKDHFPSIIGPRRDDTCTATQDRQNAVRQLAQNCDLVVIVGSKNSSNSNRLAEVAISCGVEAHLIDDYSEFDMQWLDGLKTIGISAGASVPEYVVDDLLDFLKKKGASDIKSIGQGKQTRPFPLPKGL